MHGKETFFFLFTRFHWHFHLHFSILYAALFWWSKFMHKVWNFRVRIFCNQLRMLMRPRQYWPFESKQKLLFNHHHSTDSIFIIDNKLGNKSIKIIYLEIMAHLKAENDLKELSHLLRHFNPSWRAAWTFLLTVARSHSHLHLISEKRNLY